MMNKADLERTATQHGRRRAPGVVRTGQGRRGFEGVKAIFAFDDINKIQVSQGPSMSGGTGDRTRSAEPTSDDPVRFKLTRNGATSTLSINFVDQGPGAARPTTSRSRRPATCPTSATR